MTETSEKGPTRPIPQPFWLTEPFWQATRQHRLAIQRCTLCGFYNHPPLPQCPSCGRTDFHWEEVSGRGTIYGYSILYEPLVVGFDEVVPYNCVAVELDEQPGLLLAANLVNGQPNVESIGKAVEVVFESIGEGFVLPQFRLVEPAND